MIDIRSYHLTEIQFKQSSFLLHTLRIQLFHQVVLFHIFPFYSGLVIHLSKV